MSNLVKIMDGFAKDENGKIHIIPMKIERDLVSPSASRAATRSYIKHKFIPIEPLSQEFWTSVQENQAKKRKIDRPERTVRKELFKVPEKKNVKRLTSNKPLINNRTRKSINSVKKISTPKPVVKCVSNKNDLLESLLEKAKSSLPISSSKSELPNIVLFPIDEENSSPTTKYKITPDRKDTTPRNANSANSDLEFLELEQQLASAKKIPNNTSSPLTSMCTLLEKTKITNSIKSKTQKSDISSLIQQDMEEFELFKQNFDIFNQQYKLLNEQFLLFQKEHTKRMSTLLQLLPKIEENKENSIRKSLRLAEKSKIIISPAITEKIDLRKSTLNNNLTKILADTPRTRNAVNMYNSLRSDCPVLCTPKTDRMGSPTAARSLSKRIHNQCLLLQDTPKLL